VSKPFDKFGVLSVISEFRRDVEEICAVLGYFAA